MAKGGHAGKEAAVVAGLNFWFSLRAGPRCHRSTQAVNPDGMRADVQETRGLRLPWRINPDSIAKNDHSTLGSCYFYHQKPKAAFQATSNPTLRPAATISCQVLASTTMPSRVRAARAARSGSPAIWT